MTDLPRYREPMIGWPHDADICEHGMPADVCDRCQAVRVRQLIQAEVAAAERGEGAP